MKDLTALRILGAEEEGLWREVEGLPSCYSTGDEGRDGMISGKN